MLTSQAGLGGIASGGTSVTLVLLVEWETLVGALLCLGLSRLYRGWRFGEEERGVLALQASEAIHLGVDNLNVVRQVVFGVLVLLSW